MTGETIPNIRRTPDSRLVGNQAARAIRVLVADDSAVTRKIVIDALKEDNVQIVDEAGDGVETMEKINAHRPDVVVLDIWMPRRDGFSVLQELFDRKNRVLDPETNIPSVIVLSSSFPKDRAMALRCMRLGSVECLGKPEKGILHTKELRAGLYRAVCEAYIARQKTNLSLTEDLPQRSHPMAFSIVVVGSSTGGPAVLEDIIPKLPKHFSLPIVVAQHMPPHFTKTFAERLRRLGEIGVTEAVSGEKLHRGSVYIAEGGHHLSIENRVLRLEDPEHPSYVKPSIDRLFSSAAEGFGSRVLGIVLSGMGGDAVAGARAIRNRGGWVIVQSPETCMIDGMVREVLEKGLADEVLTPKEIVKRLLELGSKNE